MATVTFGTARTETVGGVTYKVNLGRSNAVTAATSYNRPVYVLSAWVRHGTQPAHWTETWRRKELLADFDWVAGNTYETDDVEELIRQLHEAAGE
ncbi:MAG: hypothetical protein ACYC9X_07450 [Dehalococcoidia bacterium]